MARATPTGSINKLNWSKLHEQAIFYIFKHHPFSLAGIQYRESCSKLTIVSCNAAALISFVNLVFAFFRWVSLFYFSELRLHLIFYCHWTSSPVSSQFWVLTGWTSEWSDSAVAWKPDMSTFNSTWYTLVISRVTTSGITYCAVKETSFVNQQEYHDDHFQEETTVSWMCCQHQTY